MVIVVEAIKSRTEKDIIISWNDNQNDNDVVRLYDKDDRLLATDGYYICRFLARQMDLSLYGI